MPAAMDDYMFRYYIDECRTVEEATSYVEILNYSVSTFADMMRDAAMRQSPAPSGINASLHH